MFSMGNSNELKPDTIVYVQSQRYLREYGLLVLNASHVAKP